MNACIAAKQENPKARCDALAQGDSKYCSFHQQDQDGIVVMPPAPSMVLYKFDLSPDWYQRFVDAGVAVKAQDVRTAAYKRATDSGVAVFGKNGLGMVSHAGLLEELAGSFPVLKIHIQPRTNQSPALVVEFSKTGEGTNNTLAMEQLIEFLSVRCWQYVHVWVNPPRPEDELVVHTCNSIRWVNRKAPEHVLRFAEGVWIAEPVEESVAVATN